MQNFGVTNKEHDGMLWYFWSGQFVGLGHQHAANQKREGIWAELTFAKTSGIVTKDMGKN